MKAAIFHGKENIRIEEVVPQPLKPGEVRVQIAAALTCGTDLKVLKRGYHAKMITPPSPFGHELAGTISEIATLPGNAQSHWKVGDRVVVANSAPCGDCFFCQNHQENLCEDLVFLNGAYAESIIIPPRFVQKNMVRLKPHTAFQDAALAEPLACVVQGIEDLDLQAGQNVLVLGAGPIGLMFVALAKHLGCRVSVAGRGYNRLEAARRLGAEEVFDVGRAGDILSAVSKSKVLHHRANGKSSARHGVHGFDVVIEAVGKPETWEAAVQLVRKGGSVNFFGGCPSGASISLDTGKIHYSNLKLLASFHHKPKTFRHALGYIEAGVIQAKDFVDGQWPLTKLPELFQQMAAGNAAVKTLVNVRE